MWICAHAHYNNKKYYLSTLVTATIFTPSQCTSIYFLCKWILIFIRP